MADSAEKEVIADNLENNEQNAVGEDNNLDDLYKQRELLLKQLGLNSFDDFNENLDEEQINDGISTETTFCESSTPVCSTEEGKTCKVDSSLHSPRKSPLKKRRKISRNFSPRKKCSKIRDENEEENSLPMPRIDEGEINENNEKEKEIVNANKSIIDESENRNDAQLAEKEAIVHDLDEDDDDDDDDDEDLDLEAYHLLEKTDREQKQKENIDKFNICQRPPILREKIVLKRRQTEYFEVLPDGWIEATHSSGLPVYLHKATRVCTLSRPYFLGPGSVRKHQVPISAVPCLHQQHLKEAEIARKKQLIETEIKQRRDEANGVDLDPLTKLKMPHVKVQSIDDNLISAQNLRDYCQKKFDFETIQLVRFRSWNDHRRFNQKRKQDQVLKETKEAGLQDFTIDFGAVNCGSGRPGLPSDTKLITMPDVDRRSKPHARQFCLNPRGKTPIAVLHEYVQKILKGLVAYEFNETRNSANPYTAKIKILNQTRPVNGANKNSKCFARNGRRRIRTEEGNKKKDGEEVAAGCEENSLVAPEESANQEEDWVAVGIGHGISKRKAKEKAAEEALKILLPGLNLDARVASSGENANENEKCAKKQLLIANQLNTTDLDLFDLIPVVDSRVFELSIKAGQPPPFIILQECLKRHAAFGDTRIEMEIKRLRHQQHEFIMRVGGGRHEVKVRCTNKRDGKQKASQFMLQKLQPQLKNWGSLIREYGYAAQLKLREHRRQKDDVIKLQNQHLTREQNCFSANRNESEIKATSEQQRQLEPNTAILAKLRKEMMKLYQNGKHLPDPLQKTATCLKMIDI